MIPVMGDKDPDVAATYYFDWQREMVQEALRDQDFEENAVVRAQIGTGFYYVCTTAGRTSQHYPTRWPRADGQIVQDGSVVWTCRDPGSATLPSISSADWTVPAGITKDSQSESGFRTFITLSGGTDGVDYEITCLMTPSIGNPSEQTFIVPVRSQ